MPIAFKWIVADHTSESDVFKDPFVITRGPVANGDVQLAWFQSVDGSNDTTDRPYPSWNVGGWTLQRFSSSTLGAQVGRTWLYRRVITSAIGEPTTYLLTMQDEAGFGWGPVEGCLMVACYSGVNTTTPIRYEGVNAQTATTTTLITCPNVANQGAPNARAVFIGLGSYNGSNIVPDISGASGFGGSASASPTVNTRLVIDRTQTGNTARGHGTWYDRDLAGSKFTDSTTGLTITMSETHPSLGHTIVLNVANTAPNAPTLTSPANNEVIAPSTTHRFTWVFSDPDSGDAQSYYELRYRVLGNATWTTVTATTPNLYRDISIATTGNYEWQVRTQDQYSAVGPWSASSYFGVGVPPTAPTITAPAAGATVGSSVALEWSAPKQEQIRIQRVNDSAGVPGSTVYFDETITTTDRARTVNFDVTGRAEHVRIAVFADNMWSAFTSVRVSVAFVAPPVPTMTVTAVGSTIRVQITNPTPGGGQPAVARNEVWVDDGTGNGFERRVSAVAVNGTWIYQLPKSAYDYLPSTSVRVIAVGTNGATSQSL